MQPKFRLAGNTGTRLVHVAELEEAVTHAQAHARRTPRVRPQRLLVVGQGVLQ